MRMELLKFMGSKTAGPADQLQREQKGHQRSQVNPVTNNRRRGLEAMIVLQLPQ